MGLLVLFWASPPSQKSFATSSSTSTIATPITRITTVWPMGFKMGFQFTLRLILSLALAPGLLRLGFLFSLALGYSVAPILCRSLAPVLSFSHTESFPWPLHAFAK